MCSDQKTAYNDHSSSIQQNHIRESEVHLNKYGTIVFANNFSNFLSEYYWWGYDNINKIHLVKDNYNEELKSYWQVLDKENQMSVSKEESEVIFIKSEHVVNLELRVDFRSFWKTLKY